MGFASNCRSVFGGSRRQRGHDVSATRICVLIVALAGIGLAAVHLRAEQTRCVARLLKLESEWIALRREWWSLQTRAARLRTPQYVHSRIHSLHTGLLPPEWRLKPRPSERLASLWDRSASLRSRLGAGASGSRGKLESPSHSYE